jgi:hypothetical protein
VVTATNSVSVFTTTSNVTIANDAPTLNLIADRTIGEDDGLQSVSRPIRPAFPVRHPTRWRCWCPLKAAPVLCLVIDRTVP